MFRITVFLLAITMLFVVDCSADDGQSFLNERLPAWEKIVDSRNDFGCIRYSLFLDGKVAFEGMMNSSDGYRISEKKFANGSTRISFSNDEYNADIEIVNGESQILSLDANFDDFWDFHFLMTSFHSDFVFPKLIRNGKIKIEKYHNEKGMHYFCFRLGNGELFESNELVFDEFHPLPIQLTNCFSNPKGDGQIMKFLKFDIIREMSIPTEIEYENFSQSNPSSFGKFVVNYDSTPIDKSKCFLEYYGLSKPGYTVAKRNEKSRLWIYVGIGLLLIFVSVFLVRRISK